jgi:hypothetical protein
MKHNFFIPLSANVIVRWFRAGVFTDTLIPRPANNEMLRFVMVSRFKVGHSEIRAVKVDRSTLIPNQTDLNSLAHRWA